MNKVYAEVGIGNGTLFSSEFEEGETEYRVPKFVRPQKVDGYYVRLWVLKTMIVVSTNEGIKVKKKNRNCFKFLFGISGKGPTVSKQ